MHTLGKAYNAVIIRNTALVLFVAALFYGCSSTPQTADVGTIQGRRLYEWLKYHDPATGLIPLGIRAKELAFAHSMPGYTSGKQMEQVMADGWQQRGPYNIGGRTRAFAIDVTNSSVMLAGGVSGGVWKSTNSGATWTITTKPDQLHSVTYLAQDPRAGKTNVWYYCTGEAYGNSAQISGNGIWKSTDGGNSWEPIPSTVSTTTPSNNVFAYAWRIVVNPTATADELYVATSRGGIYRSGDGGTTWQNVLPSTAYFADLIASPTGTLFATLSMFDGSQGGKATRWGVFSSTNGTNWENISPPDIPAQFDRSVVAIAPSHPDQLWLIAATPNSGAKGLFVLRDGTREEWHSIWKRSKGVWQNKSANIPLFGGRAGDLFSQGGYDLLIGVHPTDTNLVVVGGTNLYRSTNGFSSVAGNSWIGGYDKPKPGELFPSYPNHHPDQHGVVFHPENAAIMFSYNDAGIMRTNNIKQDSIVWEELNNGYYTTQHYAISVVNKAGDPRIMGGMQDNGTWAAIAQNEQQAWVRRGGGDGSYNAFLNDGKNLITSTQQGRITRVELNDAGIETAKTRIDPIGGKNYLFINPFTIDPNNENVMYLPAGQMMWRNNDITAIPMGSTDSTAVNWDSLSATRLESAQITAVAASTTPAHTVYYGTSSGLMYKLLNAHTGQPVPQEITGATFPKNALLNCITVSPEDANHIIVCHSNYGVISIHATNDGGATWEAVSGNLEENPNGSGSGPAVNWVNMQRKPDGEYVYVAATSTGMYYAPQLNGASTIWIALSPETIGNVPCDMVLNRTADKRLFVGSHGRGVFEGALPAILPQPPSAPTLVSPITETKNVLNTQRFTWNKVQGAVAYQLEISSSQDFATGTQVYGGLKDSTLAVIDIEQGPMNYFWRVRAYAAGGRSNYSPIWKFTTGVVPPVHVSPATGTQNVPGSPVLLRFSNVGAAEKYNVQVSLNTGFSPLVAEAEFTDTTASIYGLESNKRYWWRVQSGNTDGFGLWSTRTNFVTGTLTSLSEEPSADENVQLTPNPASTHITVQLAADIVLPAWLTVVDELGKQVLQFVQTQTTQTHNVQNLASARYVLKVRSGDSEQQRALIIQR